MWCSVEMVKEIEVKYIELNPLVFARGRTLVMGNLEVISHAQSSLPSDTVILLV